jgi:hypothetical protein
LTEQQWSIKALILADDCIELGELIVEHPPVVIRKSRAIESRW